MPDRVKEKLVEWLCEAMILFDKRKNEKGINPFEVFANHLIAHGVTVQEWISVKDRLPEGNERVLACYINPLRKDRPPRMMVGEGTSTQIAKGESHGQ